MKMIKNLCLLFVLFATGNLFGQNPDCAIAAEICTKGLHVVPPLSGSGAVDDAALNNSCLYTPNFAIEANSHWVKWTISEGGQLAFTLNPHDESADLDFVVFKATEQDNCSASNLEIMRCMASGDFEINSPCMGTTGLNFTSTDVEELPGCSEDDDNFLAALDVLPGEQYYLMINNFTGESGLDIALHGTANLPCDTTTTSIDKIVPDAFAVQPNPFAQELNISLPDGFSGTVQVAVYHPSGQFVFTEKKFYKSSVSLNLQQLLPGNYFLQVTHNQFAFTHKILKLD